MLQKANPWVHAQRARIQKRRWTTGRGAHAAVNVEQYAPLLSVLLRAKVQVPWLQCEERANWGDGRALNRGSSWRRSVVTRPVVVWV